MQKIFEVHQQLSPIANKYHVLTGELSSQKTIAFVQQKRFALKEHFEIFADSTKSRIIAVVKANKALDLGAAYTVLDDRGQFLGLIKKEFKKSIFNSSWTLYKDEVLNSPVFTVKEKSHALAITRRLWGFVPLAEFIPFPLKFHFVIEEEGRVVGEYSKLTLIKDKYALMLEEKSSNDMDVRVWITLAIMLDALESR